VGCYLGLDIGTTSTKAAAFDLEGRLLALRRAPYPTHSPRPGFREQDPEEVVGAALGGLAALLKEAKLPEPRALTLSTPMHSLLGVDAAGRPCMPLSIWADTRAAALARQLRARPLGLEIYRRGGTPIHSMAPLCRLMWWRREAPERYAAVHRWGSLKSFLVHRLFGRWMEDHSVASASALFDAQKLEWIPPALELAGLSPENLPEPAPAETVLGGLPEAAARRYGLPQGLPVVLGGSDGCLANLGARALEPTEAVLSIGTSAALRFTTPQPLPHPAGRLFNYRLTEGFFVCGGASNNGGNLLDWWAKTSARKKSRALHEIFQASEGAEGLLFLPYLFGERAPLWDETASAAFLGLRPHHDAALQGRAVLEGQLFNLRLILEDIRGLGVRFERVLANGGFTQAPQWVQLAADVLGLPVLVAEGGAETALGAALLARKALDETAELRSLRFARRVHATFHPRPQSKALYAERFQAFREAVLRHYSSGDSG